MKESELNSTSEKNDLSCPDNTECHDQKSLQQTDGDLRGGLHDRLIKAREIAESAMHKILEKHRFEDVRFFEFMARQLLRMAISIKYRSYDSCTVYKSDSLDAEVLKALAASGMRCLDAAHELTRFMDWLNQGILAGKIDDEEMYCAGYEFGELVKNLDLAFARRDYLIMEAEMYLPRSQRG